MIRIYSPDCMDFSTNGLATLMPTECTIEEYAAGLYELTLEHPIDDNGRWTLIEPGRIIKAPAPKRESPLYESEAYSDTESETVTVDRWIYKVNTVSSKLNMRSGPGTNYTILGAYNKGTEVVGLDRSDHWTGDWLLVSVLNGGAVGWMSLQYLAFSRIITEVISTTQPVTRDAVSIQPSRDQLFRIYSVEVDSLRGLVTAKANHIFYDLAGNLLNGTFEPQGAKASTFVGQMAQNLLNPNNFVFYTPNLNGSISGVYSYRSPVDILLDPDDGIACQTGAVVVRDNFDVFLLPDEQRDMGVIVRRKKNLIGVVTTMDASDVVTRIIPIGKDGDGNDLLLDGQIYIDSPLIDDYPFIRAACIEYDVRVVDSDPNWETTFPTVAAAREKMRALAQTEFEVNGVDKAAYEMDVDFVMMDSADESQEYASLQAVHLYDTATIIDEMIGIKTKLRMVGYTWDALTLQYKSAKLGSAADLRQTAYKQRML